MKEYMGKCARVTVVHDSYGCDSGCCGHRVLLWDADGNNYESSFDFGHPYGQLNEEFIKELVVDECGEEGLPLIDFDGCEIYDD